MKAEQPLALIIVGPTASGKTALSLQLAREFGTSIISADSRQCFTEMNIGTAKPSKEELSSVKHFFINSHSIHDHMDAAVFEQYAMNTCTEIFLDHPIAIITGGTGLYVKAFCEGMDDIPQTDVHIRKDVLNFFEQNGVEGLQQWLLKLDPDFMQKSHETNNPSRLMRAIEIKLQTGQSISEFRKDQPKLRPFRMVKLGISWPRELLYERINLRVEQMMEEGLLEEVKLLKPFEKLQALQTVGYQELFEHLNGKYNLLEAVEKIKQHTRNYAKRQETWFKKDKLINWFSYDQLELVLPYVRSIL